MPAMTQTRDALMVYRNGRMEIRCATRGCEKLLGTQSPSVRIVEGDISLKCPRCGEFHRIPPKPIEGVSTG